MGTTVTMLAFGRKGYAYAAANLIGSLRHFGYGGGIDLWVDARCRAMLPGWVQNYATLKDLPPELGNDPGWIKVNLPKLIDAPTVYMDVDAVCLKDVTPWMEELTEDGRDYITTVMGKGKVGEVISYYEWATPLKVQEKEALPEGATLYGIQSSWAFMRPGVLLDGMYQVMSEAYQRWTVKDLKHAWGGTKPDELFWGIACTKAGHDPAWIGEPVHWGKGFMTLPEMQATHHLLSLWGTGRGNSSVPVRHVEKYDAVMRQVTKGLGIDYQTKSTYVREDKWSNQRNNKVTHGMLNMR